MVKDMAASDPGKAKQNRKLKTGLKMTKAVVLIKPDFDESSMVRRAEWDLYES
jgi:hypothetical protein